MELATHREEAEKIAQSLHQALVDERAEHAKRSEDAHKVIQTLREALKSSELDMKHSSDRLTCLKRMMSLLARDNAVTDFEALRQSWTTVQKISRSMKKLWRMLSGCPSSMD